MEFLGLLPSLLFLIIVGAAIYGIISWRRRADSPDADPGIGTVRRLYFYTVAIVSLMMSANGVVLIIRFVLQELFGGSAISSSTTSLAGGVALIVVGMPLWFLHWRFIQRYVRELPVEGRSILRKFYMYVVLGIAGALFLNSAVQLLLWIFGTGRFSGYHWGALIIWSAVWVFHWRIEQAEGQPTADTLGIRRLYVYLVSLVTLAMLVFGLGRIAYFILLEGYNVLASIPVLLPGDSGLWRPDMREAVAAVIVGGGAWALHWLYIARGDFGSVLRQVYLYVFAILGGIVTIMVALGIVIDGTLVWLLGGVTDETAGMHFRFLPGAVATLAVGVGLWAYHWLIVQRETQVSAQESQAAKRSYAYILAAIGLGALAFAIFTLVGAALNIFVAALSDTIIGRDAWQGTVATSITLAILGLPLWGYYWRLVQKSVSDVGVEERITLARRIFIFGALGVGVLALLGSVSGLLFIVLQDVLDASVALSTLREAIIPISVIVAAAVFLPYYWGVYKQDRDASPEVRVERPTRKDVTVLTGQGAGGFVTDLETALGHRVTTLRWADADASQPQLSEAECQQLAARINEATGPRVILIPQGEGVRVLSYS